MKLYIKNTACIAPVELSIWKNSFDLTQTNDTSLTKLQVVDPVYKERLSLNIIRRVAKYTKMGLYTALECLENKKTPSAIIVGTGIGGFLYSEKFLLDMVNSDEKNLSPNSFFQSLHSSLSGMISITTKCYGYNITYVNRGTSFETTIVDAMVKLKEDASQQILIGASDEITENYAKIIKDTAYLNDSSLVPGEGAAFMLVSGEGMAGEAYIRSMQTIFKADATKTQNSINELLEKQGLKIEDLSLVIADQQAFSEVEVLQETPSIFYKKYIGEYPTTAAFAVWLADKIVTKQHIPVLFETQTDSERPYNNVLILNRFKNDTSIILISI